MRILYRASMKLQGLNNDMMRYFFSEISGILRRSEYEVKCMKRYRCLICGYIYDEADGWPEDGIAPGTRWEDIPDEWQCPDCGATKSDFMMVQVTAA